MIEQIAEVRENAFHVVPAVNDPAFELYCRRLARHLTGAWPTVLHAKLRDIVGAERRGPPAVVAGTEPLRASEWPRLPRSGRLRPIPERRLRDETRSDEALLSTVVGLSPAPD